MKKVGTKRFRNVNIDFFKEDDQIWMKRRDLGEALGYSYPSESTAKLHSRYKGLFHKHTKYMKLDDPNGRCQETALYNSTAVTRFCCISDQKTAKFLDWYYYTIARLKIHVA